MSDDAAKQKEELIRLLGDVDQEAEKLEALGHDIVQFARFTRDVARPLVDLVTQLPESELPPSEWRRQVCGWQSWHESARQVQGSHTNVNSFVALSSAVANTTVSGVMTVFSDAPYASPSPPPIEVPKTKLFQTLDRFPLVDRAVASMRRLCLDTRSGGSRAPLDLLNEARGALERPAVGDGGTTSVLIPLRESIDATITELVRRRPSQGPVKGWNGKIVSVGSQCGRPSLPSGHFSALGTDAETLMNQLSGAKQAGMSRDQVSEYFNRGLLFLNALMDSIDETLLR